MLSTASQTCSRMFFINKMCQNQLSFSFWGSVCLLILVDPQNSMIIQSFSLSHWNDTKKAHPSGQTLRVAVASLANNAVVVNCIHSTECGDRHLPQLDHSAKTCKIQEHHIYIWYCCSHGIGFSDMLFSKSMYFHIFCLTSLKL